MKFHDESKTPSLKNVGAVILLVTFYSCITRQPDAQPELPVITNEELLEGSVRVKRKLSAGWVLEIPSSYAVEQYKGIDSSPGAIISNDEDSLYLEYDVRREFLKEANCGLSSLLAGARNLTESRYFREQHDIPDLYDVLVDSVRGRRAIFLLPKDLVYGVTSMELYDCKTDMTFSIRARGLTEKKRELVLTIFRTAGYKPD